MGRGMRVSFEAELSSHYSTVRQRLSPKPVPRRVTPPQAPAIEAPRAPQSDASINISYSFNFDIGGYFGPQLLRRPLPRVSAIVDAACEWLGFKRNELMSRRRFKEIVRARHIVFYLGRELTSRSYPEIGRLLGDFDHTSIMNGCRKIERQLSAGDPELAEDVSMVRLLALASVS